MIGFLIIAFMHDRVYTITDYVVVGTLFLAINIYPITLQRHNRIRIIRLLEKQGTKTPYE